MLLNRIEKSLKGVVLNTTTIEAELTRTLEESGFSWTNKQGTEVFLPYSNLNRDIISFDRIYRWEISSLDDLY